MPMLAIGLTHSHFSVSSSITDDNVPWHLPHILAANIR